jgi:enoyl-[acyl-carrier protein] reductase I
MSEDKTPEQFFADLRRDIEGPSGALEGKKAIVLGIANNQSIAYGCALAFKAFGADVAMTYLNEKTKKYTEPLAEALGVRPELYLPCDVSIEGQLEAVFAALEKEWGKLDIALHSIAFAPREDLHGRVVDCSRQGFLQAMDISCHSFIRMAHLAEPLMKDGGVLITMTYFGAERVVEHYNVMGPVKAALEASARYLAAELGPKGIRVHPVSPGPIKTRAASGIGGFDELMEKAAARAPQRALVSIEDVGLATAFLASDYAKLITGDTMYIDGGYHIVG